MNKIIEIFLIITTIGILSGIDHPVYAYEDMQFASGEQKNTLVELFTSQGCSSCPRAEKWLNKMVDDEKLWKRIIPVAFHVDYWDYLGWKDTFSSSALSDRQRRLSSRGAITSVYTPCFVVNGSEWRGWFQGEEIPVADEVPGVLEAVLRSGTLDVVYKGKNRAAVMHVAILGFGFNEQIKSGENRNRLLKENFVVLYYDTYISNNNTWSIQLPETTDTNAVRYAIAIWVSGSEYSLPVQTAGSWLM